MEPLLDTPKRVFGAIGVGNTKGYELIAAGELEAIKIGRATRITVASARRYVDKLIAEQRREAA